MQHRHTHTQTHAHTHTHRHTHNLQVIVLLLDPLPHLFMRLTVTAYSFNGSTLGMTYIADEIFPEVLNPPG